jgi:hypothetical protein
MSDPADEEEDLIELIREKGECVCSVCWNENSGYPFDVVDRFYKFKNEYWHDSFEELFGPFESLAEAMSGFGIPNDAINSIECTELTAAEFAKRFGVHDASPGDLVEINGEWWEVSPDGKLERSRD